MDGASPVFDSCRLQGNQNGGYSARERCAVLFVNDASSDVFVFDAGQILAVRTLRTGLDSLRDAIAQTLDIDPEDPRCGACLRRLGPA